MPASNPETSWFQIVLRVPGSWAELVSDWFLAHGCLGIEERDAGCLSAPEDLPAGWLELRAPWGADGWPEQMQARLERFLQDLSEAGSLPEGATMIRIEPLAREDWANNWRAHFEAVRLGRFFVHPGWIEAETTGSVGVRIDPGLAFGTGMHPTTRLCMLGLDRLLERMDRPSVLDVGCGSGILAIAAARAGAPRVVAMDNDPQACEVAEENLGLNGVAGLVDVRCGLLSGIGGRYAIVLANILSSVLLQLKPELIERLAPGGRLLLSGLLAEEADGVERAYREAGLVPVGRQVEGEWAMLELEKPA